MPGWRIGVTDWPVRWLSWRGECGAEGFAAGWRWLVGSEAAAPGEHDGEQHAVVTEGKKLTAVFSLSSYVEIIYALCVCVCVCVCVWALMWPTGVWCHMLMDALSSVDPERLDSKKRFLKQQLRIPWTEVSFAWAALYRVMLKWYSRLQQAWCSCLGICWIEIKVLGCDCGQMAAGFNWEGAFPPVVLTHCYPSVCGFVGIVTARNIMRGILKRCFLITSHLFCRKVLFKAINMCPDMKNQVWVFSH